MGCIGCASPPPPSSLPLHSPQAVGEPCAQVHSSLSQSPPSLQAVGEPKFMELYAALSLALAEGLPALPELDPASGTPLTFRHVPAFMLMVERA